MLGYLQLPFSDKSREKSTIPNLSSRKLHLLKISKDSLNRTYKRRATFKFQISRFRAQISESYFYSMYSYTIGVKFGRGKSLLGHFVYKYKLLFLSRVIYLIAKRGISIPDLNSAFFSRPCSTDRPTYNKPGFYYIRSLSALARTSSRDEKY